MLRPLPFVEFGPDGLVLHDTVREVVAALLRVNYRPWWMARTGSRPGPATAARTAHRPADDLWRYTADLLYLIENPAVREAFFPTASHQYAVESARPADEAQITAIARAHQPAEAVAMMRRWWETMPSAFRVARDPDGSPAAFQCLCEATAVPPGSWPQTRWPRHGVSTCVPTRCRVASRCSFSATCWPPTAAKPRRRP